MDLDLQRGVCDVHLLPRIQDMVVRISMHAFLIGLDHCYTKRYIYVFNDVHVTICYLFTALTCVILDISTVVQHNKKWGLIML